ncbi:hypothetical protein RhiirA1_464631 [Rhizophagus irregularis]|uniref:Uncharacterized protein n=1 Tax=Rhizophagus irregularis TaxID=588596 RepID=A0A2N0RHN9_9GLOM|nr:hypothetical protein RhiirA1_464631 [Rhizophagus irregularis]
MSSKNNYEQRTLHVQKIPQNLRPDCKEMNDYNKVKEVSSKNNYKQRTPHVQKKPQTLRPDCKETNDCNKVEEVSSKNNYEQRTPHVQKKPQNLPPGCKETNDCNKIKEVIDNFHENPINQNKVNQFSIFNAKFTLNNVSSKLEDDLSKILSENLYN